MFAPKDAIQFTELKNILENVAYTIFSDTQSGEPHYSKLKQGAVSDRTLNSFRAQQRTKNGRNLERFYDELGEVEVTKTEVLDDLNSHVDREIKIAICRLFTAWALCKFLTSKTCFFYAPSGQMIYPSSGLVGHKFDLEQFEWKFPLSNKSMLASVLLSCIYDGDMSPLDPVSYFHLIDAYTGTISTKHLNEIKSYLQYFPSHEFDKTIAVAKNFDGWSVCFNNSVDFETELKIAEWLGIDLKWMNSGDLANKKPNGRPRKWPQALNDIIEVFPQGWEGKSTKKVYEAIERKKGKLDYGTATLKLAMNEFEKRFSKT